LYRKALAAKEAGINVLSSALRTIKATARSASKNQIRIEENVVNEKGLEAS
jgi:hypothetical protein